MQLKIGEQILVYIDGEWQLHDVEIVYAEEILLGSEDGELVASPAGYIFGGEQ